MDKEEFQYLASRISDGTATENEVARYNYYYNQFQQDTAWNEAELGKKSEMEQNIYQLVTKSLPGYDTKIKKIFFLKIVAAAAAIALFGVLIYQQQQSRPSTTEATANILGEDIAPGTNKAELTLSDGTIINLDQSQDGLLADQGTAQIQKLQDGHIAYISEKGKVSAEAEVVYNTITIPRGGQYRLKLPDGTNVWLNASSTLKFPVAFTDKSRIVELEGEAYFEVTSQYDKNGTRRQPFIVRTATQTVEVLGTHFNINTYESEGMIKTTLIEGAVKVSSSITAESKMLKPGQQAQLTKYGTFQLAQNIDTEEVLAWKNSLFYFNNTELSAIMGQLSRWYNVEIDIEDMPQKRFNGMLSRNVKLSQVLQMMEKTSGLKFKVEERRISMRK